ncbi:uncharacterized protein METZ01_LOCUS448533, partial [marine metagenome]
RTQKFDFKPISLNDISTYLKGILISEKITYDDEGICLISQKADGSLRDALSLLDQVIAYAGKTINVEMIRDVLGIIEENVFLDVMKFINEKNHQELIMFINKLLNDGFSISDFISGFNEFIRHCMLCKGGNSEIHNLSEDSIKWLKSDCQFSTVDILRMLDLSLQFESNLKHISQPQISLEALFMKLALLESSIDIAQVLSGKKNLDTPVKKPTTSTPSATRPNQPEEKEMQLPVEKATPDKEPESISEPKDESHST